MLWINSFYIHCNCRKFARHDPHCSVWSLGTPRKACITEVLRVKSVNFKYSSMLAVCSMPYLDCQVFMNLCCGFILWFFSISASNHLEVKDDAENGKHMVLCFHPFNFLFMNFCCEYCAFCSINAVNQSRWKPKLKNENTWCNVSTFHPYSLHATNNNPANKVTRLSTDSKSVKRTHAMLTLSKCIHFLQNCGGNNPTQ